MRISLALALVPIVTFIAMGQAERAYAEEPALVPLPPPGSIPELAPPPPYAPVPAQRTVHVHVKSSQLVTLDVLTSEATFWRHVCDAPCDTDAPLEGLYRVAAHGVAPSRTVELEAAPGDSVVLDVSLRTNEDHELGRKLTISSYVAAAVGLGLEIGALSISPSSDAQPALLWGGVGAAVAAVALTISSYVLQQPTGLSQSSVTHAGAPAPSAMRLPIWREASAVTSAPPTLMMIPILSTTF
jgi:hypothetical protein